MKFHIVVLPGDGVGPEITEAAVNILQVVGKKFGHTFELYNGLIGGAAIDATGGPLPSDVLKMSRESDAVLMGAVGDPRFDAPDAKARPEDGILALRRKLRLFANLRPVRNLPMLVNATNLKPEVVEGVDFIFVRELTGGLYFGRPKKRWQTSKGWRAVDTMTYSEQEIERVVRVGFELARGRGKKLVSVDKANVLECSRLWRQVATGLSAKYPDVELEHMRAYEKMVSMWDGYGEMITDPNEIVPAIKRAAANGKPSIINVEVDKASSFIDFSALAV